MLLLAGCRGPSLLVRDDSGTQLRRTTIAAPDPSETGRFGVRFLYYGSGTDRRRAAYRDSVAFRTRPVNGTPYLRGSDRKLLAVRWKYWGFDEKRLPVNGRVWYPDGAGPFPLVLIVHGNHDMKKYSDPGYAYLGELLASRGYILVSVDENFLNGDLRDENDARGWMLLQHLADWKQWSGDSASVFYRKVDMSRIALMGHSRGGEAVAVAAAFNRLTHYPDDARVTFDFNFDIRTLVAIAPVDGQYRPAGHPTPLENVNYFVLHGSHDSDVQTFMGVRQLDRVHFTGGGPWVKAGLYVYRANHGQFNTVWGDNDVGPSGWLLAKHLLLSGEAQRQVAKVMISGFLDLTLRDRREYLPMFRDHRAAGAWLPATIYLSRFEAPGVRVLADFEEDIDVTTGSSKGVRISGVGLATWKEVSLSMRSRGQQPFNNNVVMLGWTASPTGRPAAPPLAPGSYRLSLPDTLARSWGLSMASSLVFDLSDYGEVPSLLPPADTAAPANAAAGRGAPVARKSPSEDSTRRARVAAAARDSTPLDLTVELEGSGGRFASVRLSDVAPIRPPLTVRLWKYGYVERRLSPPSKTHDDILARYVIPFAKFRETWPGLDPADIHAVRFVFDRGRGGTILLDNVGFEVAALPD